MFVPLAFDLGKITRWGTMEVAAHQRAHATAVRTSEFGYDGTCCGSTKMLRCLLLLRCCCILTESRAVVWPIHHTITKLDHQTRKFEAVGLPFVHQERAANRATGQARSWLTHVAACGQRRIPVAAQNDNRQKLQQAGNKRGHAYLSHKL